MTFLRIIYTAPTTNVRAAMNAYAIKRHSVYRKMFLISEQSIPHAKREVQYGLKNLQLFSFPIMWLGLTVRKSGTFCGIQSVA